MNTTFTQACTIHQSISGFDTPILNIHSRGQNKCNGLLPARVESGLRRNAALCRLSNQVNTVILNSNRQRFETFSGAGAKYAFPGFDQKSRIVHRALDKRALDIEKLVLDPVKR